MTTVNPLFVELNSTLEHIPDNYTSSQYLEVLDQLLYSSVEVLCTKTNYPLKWVATLIPWYLNIQDSSKIASGDRKKVLSKLCTFCMVDPEDRCGLLRKIKLDRNLVAGMVTSFLRVTANVESLYVASLKNPRLDQELLQAQLECGVYPEHDIFMVRRTVATNISLYWEFRKWLVEKFMRLSTGKAREVHSKICNHVDLDDVVQQFILGVHKAIDKCDPDKGPLASYVGSWFQHITSSVKRRSLADNTKLMSYDLLEEWAEEGKISSLNNLEVESTYNVVSTAESINRIRLVSKVADPVGIGRLILSIDEPR